MDESEQRQQVTKKTQYSLCSHPKFWICLFFGV